MSASDRTTAVTASDSQGDTALARPAVHPLGPVWFFTPMEYSRWGRFWAGVIGGGCAAVLIIAALLSPSPAGTGTHHQLGLPPCGFQLMVHVPCPTCGMTTSFAHAVRGQWLQAARAQLGGLVLAIACVAVMMLSGYATATGRKFVVNWYRVNPANVVWGVAMFFVAAWVLKIVLQRWG